MASSVGRAMGLLVLVVEAVVLDEVTDDAPVDSVEEGILLYSNSDHRRQATIATDCIATFSL